MLLHSAPAFAGILVSFTRHENPDLTSVLTVAGFLIDTRILALVGIPAIARWKLIYQSSL